ncbi:Holliday junction branch migration protein RuvA [Bacteriovorax sp. Seq25_V]|uniref:Holliday junction branch migration protein RuvA n=1 Tax=Bacteriovorax sp. Seq25_V TaxID=1201288 RepID=UPI00038A063B|nr:Holliday junction branch migration protein RuvA [Bacteriovorax sp. Seq25_V]EQC43346.1 Holliday junction DNA helicase RuvA, N-terminal domain protein [Bacteriovorax sp. Seq25_V]
MIGLIQGEVIFSDGNEIILLTNSGIGHQIYFQHVLPEGSRAAIFISHIVREASEELFGFRSLREKKMFELLTTVKGVGPKSAFSLVSCLGVASIVDAVLFDNKKTLQKAPGVGAKAASQMILDLSGKVSKIKMYSPKIFTAKAMTTIGIEEGAKISFEYDESETEEPAVVAVYDEVILKDTLLACKELGFKEDKITPLAQRILSENQITRAEQLVHLVLKEV